MGSWTRQTFVCCPGPKGKIIRECSRSSRPGVDDRRAAYGWRERTLQMLAKRIIKAGIGVWARGDEIMPTPLGEQ